ncbi:PTS fructose transporter subunit IIABC [Streptomyces sp. FXJ7.023]|uniref:PTS fructose transporter subunit IIABC n=1 Tax=Streptomyces sp. FXJ7.023 TaxID=579932 RepID=UPI00039F4CB3
MSDMISADLVDLDLSAETKEAAARALAERMVARGRVTDLEGFLADVAAREAQMPTGLDGGIGIPHCRSEHVTEPTLAFGRSAAGIDFGAADGPADLVFLIAAPAGADDAHLTILSALARQLMNAEFTAALRSVGDAADAAALIRGEDPAPADEPRAGAEPVGEPTGGTAGDATGGTAGVAAGGGPGDSAGEDSGGEGTGESGRPFRIVAVTSCPTGIAHTYMAAESLENAGREAGVEVVVETQGSAGFTRLDPAVIAAADGVILAHDVAVREKDRFAGKPTVDTGVKAAVNRPGELIGEVRSKAARGEVTAAGSAGGGGAAGGDGATTPVGRGGESGEGYGTRLRTWLMSGVSYMVPFVAAGGLLIALGFAIGGYEINKAPSVMDHFVWTQADSWAALLYQIGGVSFAFLVPVLAGYIAYGMADRPGLVPGFVGGSIALTIDAGFLGGLAAGLISGAVVLAIQRVRIPAALRGIMPVVVIPLISSAVVGFLMFVVIGKPIASAQEAMTDWLNGLSGANAVLLGALLGLMMCFDLGGPVNKVAYTFATAGIAVRGPAAGDGPGHHGARPALQRRRARERQGRLGPGRLLHLRGRDSVRRSRPAACHPVLHGGRRDHRCPVHGLRRHAARPARRRLRGPADREPAALPGRRRGRRVRHDGAGDRPQGAAQAGAGCDGPGAGRRYGPVGSVGREAAGGGVRG